MIKAKHWLSMMALAVGLCSCDMMHQDNDDCPYGVYLTFKYDYNLERADMFNDHVGGVTLYVFDSNGKLVKTQSEANSASIKPLADKDYKMHITDLPDGKYRFIALAGQNDYSEQLNTNRAKFVRSSMSTGSAMTDLEVLLDKVSVGDGTYKVENNGLPLDTLWHGMEMTELEVKSTRPSYDTISLVRDTKQINITLRDLDDASTTDVNNYDFYIADRNAKLLWNNDVDETDKLIYTPLATWNTSDKSDTKADDQVGKIAHAYFMTSRLIYHSDTSEDGVLRIVSKETGEDVVSINLPDILSQLRNYDDTRRYSAQEFLDRGYDYNIDFFLKGGELKYANISISVNVLSWAMRIQFETLGGE